SRLFHQELNEYIRFFTAGFLFWNFISTSLLESAEIFRTNSSFIKQINLPYNIYILQHIVRQTILLMHNLVVYILVCIYFQFSPGLNSLLAIPGFLLLAVNVYWISFFAAIICSRFRDMVPIINSCVQIAFFITPISWMPRLLDQNPGVLKFNPLSYLLDIVRSPLLGIAPAEISWHVTSITAVVGLIVTFWLFSSTRSRIAFWVD
ncbi:MAG: ABC transporter permease, partial [Chlamydiales bacterium]